MLNKTDIKVIRDLIHQENAKLIKEFEQFQGEVKKEIITFKDKIVTMLDKVMGELKAIREEQAVITGYKDQIEDHETRIGKLEEGLQPQTS